MRETHYTIPGSPRIALLADLHNADPAPALASVRRQAPSLICIAGDILYGSHPQDDRSPLDTQENVLPFLRSCAEIAPTFLALGNHEWMLLPSDLATISSTGAVVLDNEWREFKVEGKPVVIGGLTSGYVTDYRRFVDSLSSADRAGVRYPKKATISGIKGVTTASQHQPETAWLDEFAATDPSFTHILMSHHPEYFPLIPASVNLVLSGHTHNGQWAYYSFKRRRWTGLWSPGQGWLPKYSKGVYEGHLVVSAGLSNTASVPRLFNPREIVYIEP